MTTNIEEALAFEPPNRERIAKRDRFKKWYFSPEFTGLENLDPQRPTLLVGNHSRFGGLEMSLFLNGVHARTGIYIRGLADRLHYNIPVWRDMLAASGAVIGSRDMCEALMADGQTLLVYPSCPGRKSSSLAWVSQLKPVNLAVVTKIRSY